MYSVKHTWPVYAHMRHEVMLLWEKGVKEDNKMGAGYKGGQISDRQKLPSQRKAITGGGSGGMTCGGAATKVIGNLLARSLTGGSANSKVPIKKRKIYTLSSGFLTMRETLYIYKSMWKQGVAFELKAIQEVILCLSTEDEDELQKCGIVCPVERKLCFAMLTY